MLGIQENYTHFDPDIIMHINTVFLTLTQLGVGPAEGFFIEDESDEWTDFIQDNVKLLAVKSYMYIKVRLLFDPPQSSTFIDVLNRQASELEWRLNLEVDPGKEAN